MHFSNGISKLFEAWLYKYKEGIKSYMFGAPYRFCRNKDLFIDLVKINLENENYIAGHEEDLEILEEGHFARIMYKSIQR